MKTLVTWMTFLVVLALMVMAFAKFFNPTDTWICQDGTWVKHGNPTTTMPEASCGVKQPETMTVKVFFGNNNMGSYEQSCTEVFPVERQVVRTLAVGEAAIKELLNGPTEQEKRLGYFTSLNKGIKLLDLEIIDGVAQVEFDKKIEENSGGSCQVSAIRAQITQTLKQFTTIKQVIISVEGRTEDALQP